MINTRWANKATIGPSNKLAECALIISKTALIFGISGQDGAYLAKLLLAKGYRVVGTSRDAQASRFDNLARLGLEDNVQLESASMHDFRSVHQLIVTIRPDEVYNLAGQSSVGLSFDQPIETLESIALGTLHILEAIRISNLPIRFYGAGSSECFGDTGGVPASEETPFRPRSPYAVAKATAFWETTNYREAYGLHACTGILFNHESPLRPKRFVTQKIIQGACQIAQTGQGRLKLGNIDISRDWGWAPEFVEAMWLMLQQEQPRDFVIATGRTITLREFIRIAFKHYGLDWAQWVDSDPTLIRPTELMVSCGDPSLAHHVLGWAARTTVEQVVENMCKSVSAGVQIQK